MIKQMILASPDMLLVRLGDSDKDNTRAAYDMALITSKLPESFREAPNKMFLRAGRFSIEYINALTEIEQEILEDAGLVGGVVPATMKDFKGITKAQAKQIFDVTYALRDADILRLSVINEMVRWSSQKEDIAA